MPSQSETTSIRNGWLLSTRLTEMAVLGRADSRRPRARHRRRARCWSIRRPIRRRTRPWPRAAASWAAASRSKSRPLGLVISHEHKSIRISQDIAHSINHRFYTFVDGRKQGVATPKTDEFIDVVIHPRYKDNVGRYMQVLRNVAINESPTSLQARLMFLEQQLSDPLTAASAAIRLEAIGNDQAKEILKQGIAVERSGSAILRGRSTGVSRRHGGGRACWPTWPATNRHSASMRLAALSAMDDATAYDALRSLLEVKSAETRYGAFRALWAMNEHDPFLHDENLGNQFHYHVLDVPGPDMVHVTQSHLPEIVLFGKDQTIPIAADARRGQERSWSTA